jgi:hypothetical protein
MPGERQNCVGCHANRSHVVPASHRRPIALLRDAQALIEPEWGVGGFSYAHIVQPVLDANCVQCHSAREPGGGLDLSGDHTDFFNVSYEHLARQGRPGMNPYTKWIPTFNGLEANLLEVRPKHWGSPASRLADIILSGHPDRDGAKRVELSPAARRRVFTWIDLDVPYYGTSESNHYDLPGCRQLVPPQLETVLREVAARRCNSCHQTHDGIPRKPYLRITNAHHNDFLMAPLAVEAGGSGRCAATVFPSQNDPDYQRRQRPRIDFIPEPSDLNDSL